VSLVLVSQGTGGGGLTNTMNTKLHLPLIPPLTPLELNQFSTLGTQALNLAADGFFNPSIEEQGGTFEHGTLHLAGHNLSFTTDMNDDESVENQVIEISTKDGVFCVNLCFSNESLALLMQETAELIFSAEKEAASV
jgi:hypothetical protein